MKNKKKIHILNWKHKQNEEAKQKSPSHPPTILFIMSVIVSALKKLFAHS